MFFAHSQKVTRLRRARIAHPYGGPDRLADWDDPDHPPAGQELSGCVVAPASTSEYSEPGRTAVTDAQSLYGPVDVPVESGDRICTPDGAVFEVAGLPRRYTSPFTGWPAGSETPLTRTRG